MHDIILGECSGFFNVLYYAMIPISLFGFFVTMTHVAYLEGYLLEPMFTREAVQLGFITFALNTLYSIFLFITPIFIEELEKEKK